MAIIPEFFFDSVVAIGIKYDINNELKWIGTGFLVGRKEETRESYTVYLVTNLHIIENKNNIFVRFNNKKSKNIKDYIIPLLDNGMPNYSKHPDADIAVIQILPMVLEHNDSLYNFFVMDKHTLTVNDMKKTGIIEGNIIYTLGFPMNMVGTNRKSPICRIGCISRISDILDDEHPYEYLIDLQSVPGNSGAPVINRPENISIDGTPHNSNANLIGIIYGAISYSEKKLDELGEINDYHEEDSGLALVHPVDIIKETIEEEYKRKGKQNDI